MQKTITRRDILKFTGGGILGVMFSPLPWKLLDDSSIWTQNWSLTPKLPHGPITTLFSHCTLCNGGCAVRAKCVSGIPYYLTGVQQHPISQGIICPKGIAGHHMAYHPLRITHPHKFTGKSDSSSLTAISLHESIDGIVDGASGDGSIAILDQQPNRIVSEVYRDFLSNVKNGIYLTTPSRENETTEVIKEMLNWHSTQFGFDFENTKLIVSFGAPLLDGWGTPGRMTALRKNKLVRFIQIESRYSQTALQSDEWIALHPGAEKALAMSIAHELVYGNIPNAKISRNIRDYAIFKKNLQNFSPEKTSTLTGLSPDTVKNLARSIAQAESAVVLSGADPGGGPFDEETIKAVAIINILIGNIGKQGGIITRREIPGYKKQAAITSWSSVPDHSIGVLIIDGADSGYALPWEFINRKMNPEHGKVVSLSPVLNELSAHADYLIPSPAYSELLCDVPNSSNHRTATFAVSTPLLKPHDEAVDPIHVVKGIADGMMCVVEIPTREEMMKQRVSEIFAQQRGTIYRYAQEQTSSLKDFSTADELWSTMIEGAVWMDDDVKQSPQPLAFFGLNPQLNHNDAGKGLPMIAHGWKGATSASQVSPVLSKIFQESELRNINGVVTVHPTTARSLHLTMNDPALLTTTKGTMPVKVKLESTVRPGTLEATIAPLPNGAESPMQPAGNNILNLCEVSNEGTWRITNAQLQKVS